jgi:hypothetical protein
MSCIDASVNSLPLDATLGKGVSNLEWLIELIDGLLERKNCVLRPLTSLEGFDTRSF